MNTPAHILMGVALFARKDVKHSGPAAAFGSVLPDLSLYILAGVSLFVLNIPAQRVFGELYFSPEWQAVFAIDNSSILWGAVLVGALLWRRPLVVAFASAVSPFRKPGAETVRQTPGFCVKYPAMDAA